MSAALAADIIRHACIVTLFVACVLSADWRAVLRLFGVFFLGALWLGAITVGVLIR